MDGNILLWNDVMKLIEKDQTFEKKWNDLYLYKDEVKKLRLRCHEFLAEDEYWNLALKSYEEESWQKDGQPSAMLYQLLMKSYEEKGQNNTVDGFIICGELTSLQEKYEGKHSDLVIELLMCLAGERQLLLQSRQVEDMDTTEKEGVLHNVQQLDALHKELDKHLKIYEVQKENLDQLKERLPSLYSSDQLHNGQNGIIVPNNQVEIEVVQCQIQEYEGGVSNTEKEISELLSSIVENANIVLTELKNEMNQWKMEQRKFYVDVGAQPSMPSKPPLHKWCAHVGQSLFDLIRCSLPKIPLDSSLGFAQKMQNINYIFDQLQLCSFVVTDQVKNSIKVSMGTKKKSSDGQDEDDEDSGGNKKFSCPKFKAKVRLLAAASIDSLEPVRAYFVHEDSLAQVDDPATYDFSKSKYPLKDTKQKGSSSSATVEKGTGIATFKSLELKSFNREKESVVAKEKFRIMFQTKMMVGDRQIDLWTMSLPIVVITGASQQCNVGGSLLWHCLNPADEGQFPPPPCPENLYWSQVKEMLDTKLKYLGGRGLSFDEEKHLVSRITGDKKANVEADPVIPFNKFCIDKMMDISDPHKKSDDRKKSATFWMWFQAVYNLINTYLKEYWKRDLILGFLNKDQAEQCLTTGVNIKPNTFLLRFSNNIITDAQGQNMCGAISVSYLKARSLNRVDRVDHMTPSHAEDFKKFNLAQILKKMINGKTSECEMKWVYPSMKSREEEYKDFLDEDPAPRKPTDGYALLKEMLIIDPVAEDLENLATDDRPKKRPVYRFNGQTGPRSDVKVAKVIGQALSNQHQEQAQDCAVGQMASGQQSGNLPSVVYDGDQTLQHPAIISLLSTPPVRGSATSSRTNSAPAVSDILHNQSTSFIRSQSLPNANRQPNQHPLSEPVMNGLKSKLKLCPSSHFTQGHVQVNQELGLNNAEDRLDMVHKPPKTITGGNDGFSSKIKPCNSPSSSMPLLPDGVKQNGSPQPHGFVNPKVEAQSPSQNVQSDTFMKVDNQLPFAPSLNATQVTGATISSALVTHQMTTSSQQPVDQMITIPVNSQVTGAQALVSHHMTTNSQNLVGSMITEPVNSQVTGAQVLVSHQMTTSIHQPVDPMITEPFNSQIPLQMQHSEQEPNETQLPEGTVQQLQELVSHPDFDLNSFLDPFDQLNPSFLDSMDLANPFPNMDSLEGQLQNTN